MKIPTIELGRIWKRLNRTEMRVIMSYDGKNRCTQQSDTQDKFIQTLHVRYYVMLRLRIQYQEYDTFPLIEI
jgi:hypothetical protein